ncbi:serine hydrolase domain-containing protein [Jiulongibacter sediminis]|uniref:Beta-lactamase-related domain-containing protein n=1 Tax=Jiulongibacter sediminis TaxID=1605367 RepID=A0A0P7BB07_9BACT|nr:serine hydrolase domain-containing protein [Jiulongibacter sediminis]KPM47634.1 hypothetical protein AFM12_14205 [Jiulongibacter sediminis]TBX23427.1 hypothetical protein TK44_14215 [Jiulongibacter sediminis]
MEKIIDDVALENNFSGVILLTKGNDTLYRKAGGFRDLERQIDLKPNDHFYIGSISKQITAALILREYEKGTVRLSDTIDAFLPEINQPWAGEVTIHHLLTHTHGITSLEEPLAFELGSQFQYSQLGYGLLSQILEKLHGQTFDKISTSFFAELGLNNTFHPNSKKGISVVNGYEENENGEQELATGNPVKHIAAGGFISNVDDLLRWNQLLHSGQILQPKTLALMKTRYSTRQHPIFGPIEYGYGLLFKEGEQNKQIGAFGYVPGFPTANYYYPENGVNLVVLVNVARNLEDFRETFRVHTELMRLASEL